MDVWFNSGHDGIRITAVQGCQRDLRKAAKSIRKLPGVEGAGVDDRLLDVSIDPRVQRAKLVLTPLVAEIAGHFGDVSYRVGDKPKQLNDWLNDLVWSSY